MSRSADHQIGRLADWQIGRSRFEIGVKESLKQNTCAAIGEENSKNLAAVERSGGMSVLELNALELGKKIKSGEVTVLEAVEACLARIKEMEPTIHAI